MPPNPLAKCMALACAVCRKNLKTIILATPPPPLPNPGYAPEFMGKPIEYVDSIHSAGVSVTSNTRDKMSIVYVVSISVIIFTAID